MSFSSRVWRLMRANANDLVSRAEDPVKILDQATMDMEGESVKLRQAVATAVAGQKRIQLQASQAHAQADRWYGRAQSALRGGDETMARQALSRRKAYDDTAQALDRQLASQGDKVAVLKRNLMRLEGEIAHAKVKKDTLKARAQAARAQQRVQGVVTGVSTDSARAAFERMENKVEAWEAEATAVADLADDTLEARFATMEGSDVEEELRALRDSVFPNSSPPC